ncbi:MAG: SWIM zinc finger family protein [Abitibacteriaceae bacterium]|nr:SWIM zinc finger family protein [Abditibacteriaceae bacterium]MBV9868574.1 SWIM zinc finger family protein [Abditibacteriaceae bacterium]
MSTTWTAEQIIALAPDASSAKAGKDLSAPRKWVTLGHSEQVIWGECQGSGKNPYQTQLDMSEPAFKCSCPSRKFPCKHGLGLFLLLSSQPGVFTQNQPPAWVEEWLQSRAKRAEKAQQRATENKDKAADPAAQAKRAESRQAKVNAGLQELELWLRDLVRGGLAAAQNQPYKFWETPAARMVDAQAPGLARMVREMGGFSSSGAGWQEALLQRLGLLYLIIEGFKRINDLPSETQADLRSLIGWTQSQEELMGQPGVRDQWLILGQRVEEEERLRVQRTWMWSRESGRAAMILNFAHGNSPLETTLLPGTAVDAELVYFPGSWPLRAIIKQRFGPPQPLGATTSDSITDALESYGAALALNPWLKEMPFALQDILVLPGEESWTIRDAQGQELPLSPRFEGGWKLLAFSGGQPLSIFGEWDSQYFLPFGACLNQKWIGF